MKWYFCVLMIGGVFYFSTLICVFIEYVIRQVISNILAEKGFQRRIQYLESKIKELK